MDLDFKDKVTVVTGVSQGIAPVIAEGLTQKGIHPALCTSDEACLKVTDQQIAQKYGGKVIAAKKRVGQTITSTSCSSSTEEIFNRADILISSTLASEFIKYNIHPNTIPTLNYIKMACGRSRDIDTTGNTLRKLR